MTTKSRICWRNWSTVRPAVFSWLSNSCSLGESPLIRSSTPSASLSMSAGGNVSWEARSSRSFLSTMLRSTRASKAGTLAGPSFSRVWCEPRKAMSTFSFSSWRVMAQSWGFFRDDEARVLGIADDRMAARERENKRRGEGAPTSRAASGGSCGTNAFTCLAAPSTLANWIPAPAWAARSRRYFPGAWSLSIGFRPGLGSWSSCFCWSAVSSGRIFAFRSSKRFCISCRRVSASF